MIVILDPLFFFFSLYLSTLFGGLKILMGFNLILIYWAGFYIVYDLHIL